MKWDFYIAKEHRYSAHSASSYSSDSSTICLRRGLAAGASEGTEVSDGVTVEATSGALEANSGDAGVLDRFFFLGGPPLPLDLRFLST
jgi:hypothetical protein